MADYVVTRKRKRYAVDPCLGYYMYAPSSDGGGESIPGACSDVADEERTAHTGITSRLAVELDAALTLPRGSCKSGDNTMRENVNGSLKEGRRNRTQLQEEDVLTVEAFLQSSSKERPTKTYRHRKFLKRQANLNDCRSSIRSSRRDPTPCHTSTGIHGEDKNGSRRKGSSKNARLRKNRKPLKERLYEAAVLTHGDPDDYYTRPEATENMASNRPALLFVPYEPASHDRAPATTHSKALIVDPRKSMAIQTASLVCRSVRGYTNSGLLSHTLDRIPLSKWNLNDGRHAKSAPKRKESKTTGDTASFAYPPLSFVSFQEAEKDYKTMFPGAGNGHFLKPHTSANIVSPPSVAPEVDNCKRNAHGCLSQPEVPSTALPGIRPGISTVRTGVHLTTATSLQASVVSGNVDIHEPHILSHNPISGESSAAGRAKSRTALLQKGRPPSLEGTPSQVSDTQNDMVSNEKIRYKLLRPLGSFVNELLTFKRNSNYNTPLLP